MCFTPSTAGLHPSSAQVQGAWASHADWHKPGLTVCPHSQLLWGHTQVSDDAMHSGGTQNICANLAGIHVCNICVDTVGGWGRPPAGCLFASYVQTYLILLALGLHQEKGHSSSGNDLVRNKYTHKFRKSESENPASNPASKRRQCALCLEPPWNFLTLNSQNAFCAKCTLVLTQSYSKLERHSQGSCLSATLKEVA